MFHVERFEKVNVFEKRIRCSTWNVLKKRMCLRKELVFHVERFANVNESEKRIRCSTWNVLKKRMCLRKELDVPRGTFCKCERV